MLDGQNRAVGMGVINHLVRRGKLLLVAVGGHLDRWVFDIGAGGDGLCWDAHCACAGSIPAARGQNQYPKPNPKQKKAFGEQNSAPFNASQKSGAIVLTSDEKKMNKFDCPI